MSHCWPESQASAYSKVTMSFTTYICLTPFYQHVNYCYTSTKVLLVDIWNISCVYPYTGNLIIEQPIQLCSYRTSCMITCVFVIHSMILFSGGELVGQLLSWIQNQINDCQLMVEEVLRAQPIESHENYWPTVRYISSLLLCIQIVIKSIWTHILKIWFFWVEKLYLY